jgi:2-methylcitrate dehydratase PrpD
MEAAMTRPAPTRLLAERVVRTRFGDLAPNAREVAKQCLLDFIGVAIAGATEPLTRILVEEAVAEGGHPRASAIAQKRRLTLAQAALVNGSAGHAHDYDDVHMAMNGHPTVPVAPAAFALAESLGRTGQDLIAAVAAGIDAECIVGRYLGPSHYAHGFHATGTIGSFGAAAASAHLLQLGRDATARAFGIAGTQAAGLKSQFGTMCKPLHAGHAAATGLTAACLAARGFDSRLDILETEQGFAATQSDSVSLERFNEAVSAPSYLPDVCFKYHAACYLTHSSIEATRALVDSNRFATKDVSEVEVTVNRGHFSVCNIQNPTSGLEAKFSLRFTTAMALAGEDTSSIDAFTDALTIDPLLTALRDKVRVSAWPSPRAESQVRVRANGVDHVAEVDVGIPLTDLDVQWSKLTNKFHALVDRRLGAKQAHALANIVRTLDTHDDLGALCTLMRGD